MNMFKVPKTKVCVRLDENKTIVAITSDTALLDLDGWEVIDEGYGDKYNYAAQRYLEKGLLDKDGIYNYKYLEGDGAVELLDIEKARYKEI